MTQPSGYGTAAPPAGPPIGPPPGARPVAPPPPEGRLSPRRVEQVPGTSFGLVHLEVPPVVSGLAVTSLIAGVISVLVSLTVGCLGVAGADGGWGGWAAGAFTLLGVAFGGAAVGLGLLGLRQVRQTAPPPAVRFTGRGLAIAGISCGGVGLAVTLFSFAVALLLVAG